MIGARTTRRSAGSLLALCLGLLALSACPACPGVRGAPAQPLARSITLLPVGEHAELEFPTIRADLEKMFPGIPVSILPREPLPEGVLRDDGAVSAERLMEHYAPRGPGLLVVLDADLSSQLFNAVYSQVDLPRGNAVLAVPRFRTLDGSLPRDGVAATDEDAERARVRAGRQAVNAVGKLFGLFPCKEERCVFHRSANVASIDRADSVCAKHGAQLPMLLESILRPAEAGAPPR